MDKYTELTQSLKVAKLAADHDVIGVADDGTCNRDAIVLRLPRFSEEKTIAAIEQAGLSGFKTKTWSGIGFLINPPFLGQARKREVAAQAMHDYLKAAGYSVSHWQQMD